MNLILVAKYKFNKNSSYDLSNVYNSFMWLLVLLKLVVIVVFIGKHFFELNVIANNVEHHHNRKTSYDSVTFGVVGLVPESTESNRVAQS